MLTHNLTRTGLALKCKVSRPTVNGYVDERVEACISTIDRMADSFGLKTSMLLDDGSYKINVPAFLKNIRSMKSLIEAIEADLERA